MNTKAVSLGYFWTSLNHQLDFFMLGLFVGPLPNTMNKAVSHVLRKLRRGGDAEVGHVSKEEEKVNVSIELHKKSILVKIQPDRLYSKLTELLQSKRKRSTRRGTLNAWNLDVSHRSWTRCRRQKSTTCPLGAPEKCMQDDTWMIQVSDL